VSKHWTDKARESDHWYHIPMGWQKRREGYGMWSGLSFPERVIALPFYLIQITAWVLKGKEYHFVGIEPDNRNNSDTGENQ